MANNRHAIPEEGLNLVPVMNLVTILIPFLLMSAEFITYSVIDTTLPAIGAAPPSDTPQEEKLMLSVLLTAEGFSVLGADKVLIKDDPVAGPQIKCNELGCPSPEAYDYRELTRRVARVKDAYEKEQNVIIVPGPNIQYEVIVKTMDALRADTENKTSDGKSRELFPMVVIAAGVN